MTCIATLHLLMIHVLDNAALLRPAEMSSVFAEQDYGPPELAVDGDIYTHAHTSFEPPDYFPWLRVDLLATYLISSVEIQNRMDTAYGRCLATL